MTDARRSARSARRLLLAFCARRRACASLAAAGRDGAAAPRRRRSEPALVYDPPAELPAPEAVRATSGQYREIPLRWDPVLIPGVAGYVVESALAEARAVPRARDAARSRRAGLGRSRRAGGAARRRRRALLSAARVRARRTRLVDRVAGASRATSAPLPAPPDGLRAWSRQPRSIPLTWDPSSDPIVAGYIVERSPNPGGPFEVVAELDGRQSTHLLDTGLGDLRVLYYRVSARNPGGERGAPSDVLRAVTKPAPLPPISLRVESRRLGAIALAWEPNVETDLLGYRLRRWRTGKPRRDGHLRRRRQDARRGPARRRGARTTTTR